MYTLVKDESTNYCNHDPVSHRCVDAIYFSWYYAEMARNAIRKRYLTFNERYIFSTVDWVIVLAPFFGIMVLQITEVVVRAKKSVDMRKSDMS